jgi:hypothetical protein
MEVVCQPYPPQVFLPTLPTVFKNLLLPTLPPSKASPLKLSGFLGGEKITADAYRVVGGKRYDKI